MRAATDRPIFGVVGWTLSCQFIKSHRVPTGAQIKVRSECISGLSIPPCASRLTTIERSPSFGSARFLLESLILAQDERWRRA